MKITSEELLKDLANSTEKMIAEAEKFQQISIEELQQRPAENSWNVLECMEHLNLYGDFYLPEIENAIQQKRHKAGPVFRSGVLGNYFAKMMLPGKKTKKIRTFKDKDPIGRQLDKSSISRFIDQQRKMLDLLKKAKEVNLSRTRAGISISRYIRLRLGDIFRVVVYHNQRHMLQAKKILEKKTG